MVLGKINPNKKSHEAPTRAQVFSVFLGKIGSSRVSGSGIRDRSELDQRVDVFLHSLSSISAPFVSYLSSFLHLTSLFMFDSIDNCHRELSAHLLFLSAHLNFFLAAIHFEASQSGPLISDSISVSPPFCLRLPPLNAGKCHCALLLQFFGLTLSLMRWSQFDARITRLVTCKKKC